MQRHQHRVNGAKDALMFHQHFFRNFATCFRLQGLCRAPYFGTFLLNENYLRKSCPALAPKMLVKLTPGGRDWQFILLSVKSFMI